MALHHDQQQVAALLQETKLMSLNSLEQLLMLDTSTRLTQMA